MRRLTNRRSSYQDRPNRDPDGRGAGRNMKLLLDESVDHHIATYFPNRFEIMTAQKMGWATTKNGQLLRIAADADFDALITVDKNMETQQNLDKLPMTIILLDTPRISINYLEPLIPEVISVLEDNPNEEFIKIKSPGEGGNIKVTRRTATVLNSDRKPF